MATTDEFVYHTTYKTVTGKTITIPPLMSRQEEQLSNSLGEILGKVPELAELFQIGVTQGTVDFELVASALTKAFRVIPEDTRKIVSVLVDEDEEWVLDNLTIRGDYLPLIMTAWNEIYHGFESAFDIVAEYFGEPQDAGDADDEEEG